MNAEELIEELFEMVEKAWSPPLTRGHIMLDANEVKQILGEIRDSLPNEIRQAKAIVADRSQIISDAKREAETIVRVAEERAKAMVNQNEIVKQAQQKANEMLSQAQVRFRGRGSRCQFGGTAPDQAEYQGYSEIRPELIQQKTPYPICGIRRFLREGKQT